MTAENKASRPTRRASSKEESLADIFTRKLEGVKPESWNRYQSRGGYSSQIGGGGVGVRTASDSFTTDVMDVSVTVSREITEYYVEYGLLTHLYLPRNPSPEYTLDARNYGSSAVQMNFRLNHLAFGLWHKLDKASRGKSK